MTTIDIIAKACEHMNADPELPVFDMRMRVDGSPFRVFVIRDPEPST